MTYSTFAALAVNPTLFLIFSAWHPVVFLLSSNYSFLFVSRLFFTQKYPSLNPLLEHYLPLTDEQWAEIKPLINPTGSAATRGRPPIDERLVLDAILWKLASNKPWYDLPVSQGSVQFPSRQTCYRRYRQ